MTYHRSGYWYIGRKIYQSLAEAFGEASAVLHTEPFRFFNLTFVAGAGAAEMGWPAPRAELLGESELARDDWPYLYISRRTVPAHYLRASRWCWRWPWCVSWRRAVARAGRHALSGPCSSWASDFS